MNPKDSVGAKKAPLRYVPPALTLEVAPVMENGAAKYGAFNWREQPVSAVTYVEAMLRHLYAWLDGQDNAEDSGLSHIAHVAASAGILLDAKANDSLIDDRNAGPAADILRSLDKSVVTRTEAAPPTLDIMPPVDDMPTALVEAWGTGDGPVFVSGFHWWVCDDCAECREHTCTDHENRGDYTRVSS